MIKGCVNSDCNSNQKGKQYTKKEFLFCPECGMPLSHVCKKCNTVLTNDESKYCIRCEEVRQDKKDKLKDDLKKTGGAVAGIAVAAGAAIPNVLKNGKK